MRFFFVNWYLRTMQMGQANPRGKGLPTRILTSLIETFWLRWFNSLTMRFDSENRNKALEIVFFLARAQTISKKHILSAGWNVLWNDPFYPNKRPFSPWKFSFLIVSGANGVWSQLDFPSKERYEKFEFQLWTVLGENFPILSLQSFHNQSATQNHWFCLQRCGNFCRITLFPNGINKYGSWNLFASLCLNCYIQISLQHAYIGL